MVNIKSAVKIWLMFPWEETLYRLRRFWFRWVVFWNRKAYDARVREHAEQQLCERLGIDRAAFLNSKEESSNE